MCRKLHYKRLPTSQNESPLHPYSHSEPRLLLQGTSVTNRRCSDIALKGNSVMLSCRIDYSTSKGLGNMADMSGFLRAMYGAQIGVGRDLLRRRESVRGQEVKRKVSERAV